MQNSSEYNFYKQYNNLRYTYVCIVYFYDAPEFFMAMPL